ncbi:MAG TPA: TolC family protein, partial [Elusimicrobiales bacterium]|nr:TolC family protein [Elusimicrobiales bacterium]
RRFAEAKKNFYAVLYQRRLSEAAEYWLARAQDYAAAFKSDPSEALEARVLLAGLSSRAREASRGLDAANTGLLKALNREPGYPVAADGALEPLPVADEVTRCLVTAMESRSDLRSEYYKAQMDDIAVNMALIRRSPTVYLGASYDISAYDFSSLSESSVRSNNWLASLAIHFPLSYDILTQVRQRKAQQRQGELKRVELQDKIRFEILAAHKEAVFWQKEAEQRKEELERLKADHAAAASARRLPDLRSLCAIADFERGWLEAVYNQLMARIRLEWAQGRDLPR